MKKEILSYTFCLMVLLFSSATVFAALPSYSVLVHFDGKNFTLERLSLVDVSPMHTSTEGEYTVRLLSHKQAVLFESAFFADLRVFDAEREFVDDRSFDFVLPYHANGKSITIFKGHERMLEVDLSQYTQCNEDGKCEGRESLKHCPSDCTCGNGVCDDDENYALCQQDCASGQADGVCDGVHEGRCDPDCQSTGQEDRQEDLSPTDVRHDYDCDEPITEEMILQEYKQSPSSGVSLPGAVKGVLYFVAVVVSLFIIFFVIRKLYPQKLGGKKR